MFANFMHILYTVCVGKSGASRLCSLFNLFKLFYGVLGDLGKKSFEGCLSQLRRPTGFRCGLSPRER